MTANAGFDWNLDKNRVDVVEHPNQARDPRQRVYVVVIDGYCHLVPFVTGADGTRFLKTIIPSRKATRDYQRRATSGSGEPWPRGSRLP